MDVSIEEIVEDLSPLNVAILQLLESNGQTPVKGKTVFQKEMFLISNYIDNLEHEANFIAHSFGPYSESSEVMLNNLISLGLIEKINEHSFKITKLGSTILAAKVRDTLSKNYVEAINDFKQFLNDLKEDEILLFIYVSYPKYTLESIVSERVMRNRGRYASSMYKKGKISLEKAAFLAGKNIEDFLDVLRIYK